MQQAMVRSVWEWDTGAEARAFLIGVEHNDNLTAVRSLLNPLRVTIMTPSLADYDTLIIYQDGKKVHTYDYAGKHIGQWEYADKKIGD